MKTYLLKSTITFVFILICISINATETYYPMTLRVGLIAPTDFNIFNFSGKDRWFGDNPFPDTYEFTQIGYDGILETTVSSPKRGFEIGTRLSVKSIYVKNKDIENTGPQESIITNTFLGLVMRFKIIAHSDSLGTLYPYVGTALSMLISQHMSAYIPEIRSDPVERGLLGGVAFLSPSGHYSVILEYQYNFAYRGRYYSSYAVTNNDRNKGLSCGSVNLTFGYSF